jgi:predicted transcriptional regulator
MGISVLKQNGYDIIYKQFIEKRKKLKYFIYMLTEKYDSDIEYSKNLKKIYDLNFETPSEGTLSLGIKTFKNDLLHQHESTIDYVNKLKEKIIEPLKKFLFEQQSQGKKLNFEMTKIDKDFREAYDKLEKVFFFKLE